MDNEAADRFERAFVPRIVERLGHLVGDAVTIEVIPREGRGHPTRVRLTGHPGEHRHVYAHPLDLSLTWDSDEILRLMEPDGEARFDCYLDAIPRKMHAWEAAREVDLSSRSQGEPHILIGGLDFEP
ncbi:DUF5594 domain-containing protein [Paraburkholderia kururiensis]|uniref:DUF5594 family protein n=1 Tax=Paraburkholderia kururiensis TaxID=984307 RepID=UPI000346289E|nr:DUF5594 family protein [Paraburkholderia kururiensis]